jgi:hypothetical protein
MIPPVYQLNRYPPLALARPEHFLEALKPVVINVGAEDIAQLFQLPETLVPYVAAQKEQQAEVEVRDGDSELPSAPDLSAVENLRL